MERTDITISNISKLNNLTVNTVLELKLFWIFITSTLNSLTFFSNFLQRLKQLEHTKFFNQFVAFVCGPCHKLRLFDTGQHHN